MLAEYMRLWGKAINLIMHSRAGSMTVLRVPCSPAPRGHTCGPTQMLSKVPVSSVKKLVLRKPQLYKRSPGKPAQTLSQRKTLFLLYGWQTNMSLPLMENLSLSSKAIFPTNIFAMIIWNKRCAGT